MQTHNVEVCRFEAQFEPVLIYEFEEPYVRVLRRYCRSERCHCISAAGKAELDIVA
jgi:hypothetical protein